MTRPKLPPGFRRSPVSRPRRKPLLRRPLCGPAGTRPPSRPVSSHSPAPPLADQDMEDFAHRLEDLYQKQPVRYLVMEATAYVIALQESIQQNKPLGADLLGAIYIRLNRAEAALRFCSACPAHAWLDIRPEDKSH